MIFQFHFDDIYEILQTYPPKCHHFLFNNDTFSLNRKALHITIEMCAELLKETRTSKVYCLHCDVLNFGTFCYQSFTLRIAIQ